MTEMGLNPDPLVDFIHEAGRPLQLNVLTRHAARRWLEARAEERHYAPGARYEAGVPILFRGQRTTLTDVSEAHNPVQGEFSILTMALSDGAECLTAANVPGSPETSSRSLAFAAMPEN